MKALAAIALLFAFTAAHAKPITFCNVCTGYTVSQRGDDVLVRCPGEPIEEPWLTFYDCHNPKVTRGAGQLTITCN